MIKRESKFSVLFRHWILANPIKHSCTFEMKQTVRDRISFSALEMRQWEYSNAIKHGKKGVLMRNVGGRGEPDYNYYYQAPAYVVVKYPGFFVVIDIDKWIQEASESQEKGIMSLASKRAREIADWVVDF